MSCSEEEINLANQLKLLCTKVGKFYKEGEDILDKSASIFNNLACLYENNAENKRDLIKAAALFNAAIVRQPQIITFQKNLKTLCRNILRVAEALKLEANLIEISQQLKEKIETMRKNADKRLQSHITDIPNAEEIMTNLHFYVTNEKMFNLEQVEIRQMQDLQMEISQDYTDLMVFVAKKCEEIMGNPPCRYCVAGMGSLARKEITPYSDFEHVIILEEGVQNQQNYEKTLEYFRWLSVVFQIIIINLGETIIPAVAIPSLNDFSTPGGSWFLDVITRRGISFDAMMEHASKFPLGPQGTDRAGISDKELIQTASNMAKYAKPRSSDNTAIYSMADIITKVCFVFGCEQVFNDFSTQLRQLLRNENKVRKEFLERQTKEDLRKFNIVNNLMDLFGAEQANIKHIFYRSLTLFISALGIKESIEDYSCFDIIKTLRARNLLSEKTEHRLLFAASVACRVRLGEYVSTNRQNDYVACGQRYYNISDNQLLLKLCKKIGERRLLEYLTTTYGLQQAMMSSNPFANIDRALIPTLLVQFKVLRFLNFYNHLLRLWSDYNANPSRQVQEKDEMWMRMYVIGAHRRNRKYQAALDEISWFDSKKVEDPLLEGNLITTKINCFYNIGRKEEAFVSSQHAEAVLKNTNIAGEEKLDLLCHGISFLGICKSEILEDYEGALTKFEEELSYLDQTYVVSKISRKVVCLYNISTCLLGLKQYDVAQQKATEALDSVAGLNGPVNIICSCLRVLGICSQKQGNFSEALTYFTRERKERNLCLRQEISMSRDEEKERVEEEEELRRIIKETELHILHENSVCRTEDIKLKHKNVRACVLQ
ncbi:unnamed protein product [Clavelina lepadiformis]|uniref:Protein-PII uridylyltransferase N-terminal domain-containing protein n=1 Tax=Clavelina lepadiformis TaxID=159417 RepID=A0ABP0F917_CLALP